MAAQFSIRPADEAAVERLRTALGLPRFLAATLVGRGLHDVDQARRFLNPSFEQDWRNPYDIPGMDEVAEVVARAVRDNKHVLVFGDFDLDGISATTVLTRALRAMGGKATPFVPRRFDEGYGLSAAAIERAQTHQPDLIVTVDCGIACKEEVAQARAKGLDIVVTDHHEASDAVPQGIPITDPKLKPDHPSAMLAGVGVVLKLVQAVGGKLGYPHLWRDYTDFATLGTVADLMPMVGENRPLVNDGLRRINEAPRPCIAALLEASGANQKPVTSSNLSFSLVPRLNAAGRMGDASLALNLLMSDDYAEAFNLATQLEATNDQRRDIEARLSEIAQAEAQKSYHGQRALVVAGEGWHEGVKGIVASRLVGIHGVPSLLFTIDGDEARGSGRSIGSVNLFKAIEGCADLLTRFGGHEAAVGVTLPAANLPAFEQRLCEQLDALPTSDFQPALEVDAVVRLDELTLEAVEAVDRLAPFGQENKMPVLLARDITLAGARAVGTDRNHLSCALSDGCTSVAAIMFHCQNIPELLATDSVVSAAFEPQVDEWRGRRTVKAMVKVLAPACGCAGLEACLAASRHFENHRRVQSLYDLPDESLCARGKANAWAAASGYGSAGMSASAALNGNTGMNANANATGNGNGNGAANPGATAAASAGAGSAAAANPNAAATATPGPNAAADAATAPDPRLILSQNRDTWRRRAQQDPQGLERAVIQAIIGDRPLHRAQREILDHLAAGRSVFGVMATGRGKSLTFQVHAAVRALAAGEASLFVYPLRALIADQAFHLREAFGRFGVTVQVLTGESSPEERARCLAMLSDGTCDIVLTTPEYLGWHASELARSGRIRFMVVDEAHHIDTAKAGQREHYATIGRAVEALGRPTVLAVTATADDEVAAAIERELPIEAYVFDSADRPNLHIDDRRNLRNRDDYLATIVATGEKVVIYVNSREQSVAVARMLRKKVPHLAPLVGFYNAGLPRAERKRVESLFRSGALTVLVATSAFGEGIDIPDVRHVVLYHLPFNEIEFNQMSGRAGRDGRDAWIHLLFGRADCGINERILADMTPDHDCMAQVYRKMRALQRSCGAPFFTTTEEALAQAASTDFFPVSPTAVSCGVAVFRELGLIEVTTGFSDQGEVRSIRVIETTSKVNLTDSVRYCEGLDERSVFRAFRDWAMESDCAGLGARVSNPILPSRARQQR